MNAASTRSMSYWPKPKVISLSRRGRSCHSRARNSERLWKTLERVVAYLGPAHPRGIERTDHRSHRGAGDQGRADSDLVQRLEHRDMRESVCRAAAEGESDARPGPAAAPQVCGCPTRTTMRSLPPKSRLATRLTSSMVTASTSPLRRST